MLNQHQILQKENGEWENVPEQSQPIVTNQNEQQHNNGRLFFKWNVIKPRLFNPQDPQKLRKYQKTILTKRNYIESNIDLDYEMHNID